MKRFFYVWLLVLCMGTNGYAYAQVIDPQGIVQEFEAWTGIEAQRAVVLCESLTVRSAPQGSADAVYTLKCGETFLTWEEQGDFINAYYSDGAEAGWVRAEYTLVNPAYYVTQGETPAYAYPGEDAPRVALLFAGEQLPIIAQMDGYYVVSLRGASAWIRKQAQEGESFSPERLSSLTSASLRYRVEGAGEEADVLDIEVKDSARLHALATLLADARLRGDAGVYGCPFGMALLTLTNAQQETFTLDLAVDSCCAYRVDGKDYKYAYTLDNPEEHVTNTVLFSLFDDLSRY